MFDWGKLSPREVTELIWSAPKFAEPWCGRVYANGVHTFERRLWSPSNGYREPGMQVMRMNGNRWHGWWGGRPINGEPLAAALREGDALLVEAGYRLDDALACNVEDGVTEYCRGCHRLKRDHPTYPNDPKRPNP